MPSDEQRLKEAFQRIMRIKEGSYGPFLKEATEQALSRMQGDGGGHER